MLRGRKKTKSGVTGRGASYNTATSPRASRNTYFRVRNMLCRHAIRTFSHSSPSNARSYETGRFREGRFGVPQKRKWLAFPVLVTVSASLSRFLSVSLSRLFPPLSSLALFFFSSSHLVSSFCLSFALSPRSFVSHFLSSYLPIYLSLSDTSLLP